MTISRSAIKDEVFGSESGAILRSLKGRGAVRSVLRVSAIAAWTGSLLVVLLVGMWAATPWPKVRLGWRNRIVKRWARGMAGIVNMRMQVIGTPPPAPFFLVANHLSYVDIVLLLANVDGVFVAKRELNQWPVVGYLTRLVGTIFLNRNSRRDARRVIQIIDQRIREGDGVMVFPEGTSGDGAEVYPMKTAMFEWAAERRHPVRVAAIHYATGHGLPAARNAICWWGTMSFVPHVLGLCRLPGFTANLHFPPAPIGGADRAALAELARAAIAGHFVPHTEPNGSPA